MRVFDCDKEKEKTASASGIGKKRNYIQKVIFINVGLEIFHALKKTKLKHGQFSFSPPNYIIQRISRLNK